jgi:rare lipoprotein A
MRKILAAMLIASTLSSPVLADGKTVNASWYQYGKVTASGEHFNPNGMTVAHKKLPFGTILLLTYENKAVIVRVNDRGPYIKGREIDMSKGVATALGCLDDGVCRIKMKIIKLG